MPDRKFTRWMLFRLLFAAAGLGLLGLVVLWRCWALQVQDSRWLSSLAAEQYLRKVSLEPMRGAILDRNAQPLAVSVMTDSACAIPSEIQDKPAAARILAKTLGLDRRELERKLTRRLHFTWIKRRLEPDEAKRLRKLDLPGLCFRRESRRYYPARELAAAVIGFAGDGRGLEGLELFYDGRLRGSTLLAEGIRDAHGRLLFHEGLRAEAQDGTRLVLTLDLTIQEIVEAELERAVRDSSAKGGMAIVADPSTGEILAMANYPGFNPNVLAASARDRFRNRAVTDCFEPGSTLKVFSLATALDAKVVRPTDTVDCGDGEIQIGRLSIHDSSRQHTGRLTVRDVLIYSKNTGMSRIALQVGREAMHSGFRRFGFGQRTGVELPGERDCAMPPPERWNDFELATRSFGQGLSVTAVQLVAALGAVANGGVLMRPRIVREVRGQDNQVVEVFESEPLGRILSEAAVRDLVALLSKVTVPPGTGVLGAVRGFATAGKTGTAQKADPVLRGYSDKRIASFVGFVPADRPRIAAVVVIDEPETSPYGGVVAGPAFARIAEATLAYLGVFPDPARMAAPSVQARPAEEGGRVAGVADVNEPRAGGALSAGGTFRMPDLRGLSVRAALRALSQGGVALELEGSGAVTAQRPEPGTAVALGESVTISLE